VVHLGLAEVIYRQPVTPVKGQTYTLSFNDWQVEIATQMGCMDACAAPSTP
jgi:hypothetical protein